MVWPRDDAAVIEAVNELRVANPSFGVRPLLAKLREQQPELGAGRKEVREALRALGPLEWEDEEEVVAARALAMNQARRAGRKEQNQARQPCSFRTADAPSHHPPYASTELWFSDGKIKDASPSHPPHGSTLPSSTVNGGIPCRPPPSEPHPAATALANAASTSTLSAPPASPATITTSTVASPTITTTAVAFTTAGATAATATSNAVSPATITTAMLEESRLNQGREGSTRSSPCVPRPLLAYYPPFILIARLPQASGLLN